MSEKTFASIFREELGDFAKLRASQGFCTDTGYILRKLDKYLVSKGVSEKNLTSAIIDGWIADCSDGLSVSTIYHYVTFARQFARYLLSINIPAFIADYPLSCANAYAPYIFSPQEMERIFQAVDNMDFPSNPAARMQFPVLLRLLYGCGLRLGEALALKVSDVDAQYGVLRVLRAKGNKDRLVPMDVTLTQTLQKYCALLGESAADPFLFATADGMARKRLWARTRFREVLREAGINIPDPPPFSRNICLHCLRHTFAVHSLRMQQLAGIDQYDASPSLSIYLGHSNLAGTQKYLHMTAENAQDIWEITNKLAKDVFPEVPQ
jgi:integrase